MVEFKSRKSTIDGFEVDTREGGSGPTLLYLHGAGGAGGFFAGGRTAPFLEELARSFRVLVPEHPGFGPSPTPDWLEDIHDLAYFYLDYLDALDLRDVHLVGSSLGGWLALEIAVRNTSRLKSLTLASAAGIHLKGVPKGDLFLWSREQFAENCLRNPEARKAFLSVEPTPEQELVMLRNQQTAALLAWEPRLYDPNLHKWLHRIDVPTHIVWPDDDRILPRAYADALARMIAGSEVSIIEDAGHLMQMDRPEAFGQAVGGFIKGRAA